MSFFSRIKDAFNSKKQDTFAQVLFTILEGEIGVQEVGNTNSGERVDQYKLATSYRPKNPNWPWCAAFVCWAIKQAMDQHGLSETDSFHRPKTPGAWAMEDWSLKQDNTTNTKYYPGTDIRACDIITFKFSHTGFAVSSPDKNGMITTIEGNTNFAGSNNGGMVLRQQRHISEIRARVRFNV